MSAHCVHCSTHVHKYAHKHSSISIADFLDRDTKQNLNSFAIQKNSNDSRNRSTITLQCRQLNNDRNDMSEACAFLIADMLTRRIWEGFELLNLLVYVLIETICLSFHWLSKNATDSMCNFRLGSSSMRFTLNDRILKIV